MSTSVFLNIQLKSCLHEKLGFDTNGTPYPQGLNDLSVFLAVIPNTGLNNNHESNYITAEKHRV